jgi:hypothetical protein
VVATDLSNPRDIAVDGTNAYYANSSTLFGTKFWKLPRTGGTPTMIALSPDFSVYEIAIDATDITGPPTVRSARRRWRAARSPPSPPGS